MTEIHDLPAHRLAELIRSRELSPTEVTEHFLDRVEREDPHYSAYVSVASKEALQQARNAEERVMSDAPDDLPPLHGVPVPIKDLDPVAGLPLTHGSRLHKETIAPKDAGVVSHLRKAGAVFLGKTNTPEFGTSCYTENDLVPATRNPWDTTRTPGGSSGGAAAAVAAGLAPVAHGSDGGGSLRIPASACGVFGLKPSRGRISQAPLSLDLIGLATAGPITRSVSDAALMLDVMAFNSPGDQFGAAPLPRGKSFTDHTRKTPGRLRIGCYANAPGITLDPDVLVAHEATGQLLEELGHDVEEIPTPFEAHFHGRFPEDFQVLWAAMASTIPVPEGREEELRPLNRWLRELAARTPMPRYMAAMARLQRGVRSLMEETQHFDALLCPTLALLPGPVGALTAEGPEAEFRLMTEFAPFTSLFNVTGQPSLSIPLHRTGTDLPIGVMLTGRPGEEGTLLSLSAQLEAARPWAHRSPLDEHGQGAFRG